MRGGAGAPEALRAGALLLLAALLVWGLPGEEPAPEGALSLPDPLEAETPSADDVTGWERLLRHAAEAPLVARVSGAPPPFVVEPPARLRAGRPAALGVVAHAPLDLRLVSPAGIEEELHLEEGERGAFLLRPRAEGWSTWTIEWSLPDDPAADASGEAGRSGALGGGTATWTGWAEPERPLRVLALGGPPDSESRLTLRALEEAGEDAEVWLHLGRDLWVGRAPGALSEDPAVFEGFDVVLLFPGLSLSPGTAGALERAVREGGTGLLLAAAAGGSDALLAAALGSDGAAGWAEVGPAEADGLDWRLPAEVEPLPPEELTVALRFLVADEIDSSPLVLGTLGRGRIGALAITDTWRWRMQAGAEAEHRAFWRSVAEWLAGGIRADPVLESLGDLHREGEAVRIRWVGRSGEVGGAEAPAAAAGAASVTEVRVRVSEPGGETGVVALPTGEAPFGATGTAAFVPFQAGGYRVEPLGPEGEAVAPGIGVAVGRMGDAVLDPEGALARLALLSPGGRIDVAGTEPSVPVRPGTPDRQGLLVALLLALLGGTLGAEWVLRRARARP